MSLLVNVYTRDASGKMIFHDPKDYSDELAGGESYRKTLYGSKAAQSLGLSLLPKLTANASLYVEGEDLARLQREAELILQHLGLFTEEADTDCECLRQRPLNILHAAQRAIELQGGVVIW